MKQSSSIGMRAAAALQFGSKYISMGANLVITGILARLIAPDDFGLVAIVTVFTGLFALLSDMGVSTAIIQYQDLSEEDYGGLFGFSVILAIGLTLAFCFFSPLISSVYSDVRLEGLCIAASPMLFFSTLNMVPNGLMLKHRHFDKVALRLVVATVVSGVIAVVAAFEGIGAYAIIVQNVISTALVFIWNIVSRPIRHINLNFMKPLRKIFSYSAFQFGFSFINYFSRNLDNMLIGRYMGSAQLGFYDKAYKLTTYPLSAISSVVGSIIQPYMAGHQDEPDVIFNCWLKIEKLLSLIGASIAAIFFCCSAEIIEIVYGPGWEPAIPVFAALAISVYFQMMGNTSGSFFQSTGHTDYLFREGLINTLITVLGLLFGLTSGSILGVAYCIGAAYCIHEFTITYYLVYRSFGKSPSCLKIFLPEVVVSVLASFICSLFSCYFKLPLIQALIFKLILLSGVICLGYLVTGQYVYFKILKIR